MCSLYTSIFSNLFQILVLCYLTLKCFQISNMLYISTYKLCVLALVFKNKKVKISKATPWFLKHDKGVIFFFPRVRGECGGSDDQGVQWAKAEVILCSWASVLFCAKEGDNIPSLWGLPGSWRVMAHNVWLTHGISGVWQRVGHILHEKCWLRHFPGSPVVKTLCFQCRGHGFNPWSGN